PLRFPPPPLLFLPPPGGAAKPLSWRARKSGVRFFWSDRIPVSRGPYLSLVGQEVAPGRCRLVAVASSGLSPLPLWISAAGQRQIRTYRANRISRSVSCF